MILPMEGLEGQTVDLMAAVIVRGGAPYLDGPAARYGEFGKVIESPLALLREAVADARYQEHLKVDAVASQQRAVSRYKDAEKKLARFQDKRGPFQRLLARLHVGEN